MNSIKTYKKKGIYQDSTNFIKFLNVKIPNKMNLWTIYNIFLRKKNHEQYSKRFVHRIIRI